MRMMAGSNHPGRAHLLLIPTALLSLLAAAASLLFAQAPTSSDAPRSALELSRPVRTWEFLPILGRRAALFGNESGAMEAWVYPLKLLRDFRLDFQQEGRTVAAASLARSVIVRPESTTIVYASDTYTVHETLFVPVHESGAVILVDVETEFPLEIEASFVRDLQLAWPAGLGGAYSYWVPEQHAFFLGEEQQRFAGLVGSPTAIEVRAEYQTNYSESNTNSFRLGVTQKGKDRKVIVIAGSTTGRAEAEVNYNHLVEDYETLQHDSSDYYRDALSKSINLDLPDQQLQQAYDWARISMLQGFIDNPFLGTGLAAGFRTSGEGQRPGFAWFFGRDAFWTSLALDSEGDFANARTALEFVSKYQRPDGKMPHEIAQTANFVPWFTDYPYAYASGDATPLYLIAANDYVTASGDVSFANEKWDSLWKAYQFLRSTYDSPGFPRNFGIGHGWVEGGPLLPVRTEFYQAAVGTEALRALANLAGLTGKDDAAVQLMQDFNHQQSLLNETFWLPDTRRFAFALDVSGKPIDEPSVLSTVPMWFGLLDAEKSGQMISQLAEASQQTDWGMRIISDRSSKFSGGGYHYGSVWPLFTGWASVGEYRYHHALPAYENLRVNALLALGGSLGHATEVLSGDYYQPLSTSSPDQIWSSAMIVSPLLRGLLGLSADAVNYTLTFAPHAPADWPHFAVKNISVGQQHMDLTYRKTQGAITLEVNCNGTPPCSVNFSPALSLRAEILGVEWNGRAVPFHVEQNDRDQHVITHISAPSGTSSLRIRLRNDFGVSYSATLPPLGAASRGLRIVSQSWSTSRDTLTLEVQGLAGTQYDLSVWNPGLITSIDGATIAKADREQTTSLVHLLIPPGDSRSYQHAQIVFHLVHKRAAPKSTKPSASQL
jgi:glycogen debranching enzyme